MDLQQELIRTYKRRQNVRKSVRANRSAGPRSRNGSQGTSREGGVDPQQSIRGYELGL